MLRAKNLRWLPNAITALRVVGGAAALILAANEVWAAAMWVYLASLLSDFLDGLAAIKLDARTVFGEMFDSLADGWLVATGLVGLSIAGHLPWWVVILVIVLGVVVQVERRIMHGMLALPAVAKKMFAIVGLFAAWIYTALAFAIQAYGWRWWYVLLVVIVLAVAAALKPHRLRAWLGIKA